MFNVMQARYSGREFKISQNFRGSLMMIIDSWWQRPTEQTLSVPGDLWRDWDARTLCDTSGRAGHSSRYFSYSRLRVSLDGALYQISPVFGCLGASFCQETIQKYVLGRQPLVIFAFVNVFLQQFGLNTFVPQLGRLVTPPRSAWNQEYHDQE